MTSSPNKPNTNKGQPQSRDEWFDAIEETPSTNPFAEDFQEASSNSAGLDLLTGVMNETATQEELELWEQILASNPEEQQRLDALRESTQQDESASSELAALLQRGSALQEDMSELPDSFWDDESISTTADDFGFAEAMPISEVSTSVVEDVVSHEVSLGEPEQAPAIQQPSTSSSGFNGLWIGLSGALALGILFMVVPTGLFKGTGTHSTTNTNNVFRAKDGKAVFVDMILRRGEKQVKVEAPFRPKRGDALRFRYDLRSKKNAFAAVFSVDSAGAFSLIYPKEEDTPFAIKPGKRVMPGGAKLFPANGRERLYVCVSDKPIQIKQFKSFFKQSLKSKKIGVIKALPLPCFYQRTWLFKGSQDVAPPTKR